MADKKTCSSAPRTNVNIQRHLDKFQNSQCSDRTCLPHPLAHLLEVDVNQENDVGKQVCVGVVVLLTIGGADDEHIWGGQGWIRTAFFVLHVVIAIHTS